MDFSHSPKVVALQDHMMAFVREHVVPAEAEFEALSDEADTLSDADEAAELAASAGRATALSSRTAEARQVRARW